MDNDKPRVYSWHGSKELADKAAASLRRTVERDELKYTVEGVFVVALD